MTFGSGLVSGNDGTVFVVDDDPSIVRSVSRMLRLAGYQVKSFPDASQFLAHSPREGPACIILDLEMPAMSGLELQQKLDEGGSGVPIVFLTAHGSVPTAVRALKAGA